MSAIINFNTISWNIQLIVNDNDSGNLVKTKVAKSKLITQGVITLSVHKFSSCKETLQFLLMLKLNCSLQMLNLQTVHL